MQAKIPYFCAGFLLFKADFSKKQEQQKRIGKLGRVKQNNAVKKGGFGIF
jgi:hypothetical protein